MARSVTSISWIVLQLVLTVLTPSTALGEPVGKGGARVARWATGLAGPQGLATDGQGHVFVVENGAGRVTRFQRDGTGATPFADGLQAPAWALWLGGTLYVSERKGNSVARVDTAGSVTRLKGEVVDPLGLTPDPKRSGAFLALSHRESRIFRFAPDATTGELRREAEPVVAPEGGAKYGWRDLLLDADGTLYATDEVGRALLRRRPGGELEAWVSGLASPSGLLRGPDGHLYVTEEGNGRVARVAADGKLTALAEGLGMARDALFLDARTLLVSDRQGGTIWQVTLP
jgi:glucose/arabinose dehydrogenase